MATRSLTIAAALAVTLVPAIVHACPVCAGREDSGPWRGIFLAMFIFFPFALVAAIVRYVRSEERRGLHREATAGDER
jgi:hypothetical protein